MPALLLDRPITKAQIADSLYRQTGLVILDAESAESADPTDDKGYLIFEALLVGALLQEWAKASADLSAGLFSLASVENVARFGAFNSHHYEAEIERLFQMASDRMAPAAAKLIAKGQQRIGGATKAAFARDYGPQVIAQNANATRQGLFSWSKGHIRWTSEDQQAMARLGQHTEYRIREYFEKNLASQARGIFNKSRAHLGNQAKISEVVQSAATSLVKRQSAYWQVTAINALTQARTYAGLRWMNQNLITAYRIVAVLDSVTTPICRSLHGRVFPVSNALAMYEQMAEARTVAELELLSPMVRSEMSGGKHTGRYIAGRGPSRWVFDEAAPLKATNESLTVHGLMAPPFHHGCRSRIEPVFTALTLPIANNPMAVPEPVKQFGNYDGSQFEYYKSPSPRHYINSLDVPRKGRNSVLVGLSKADIEKEITYIRQGNAYRFGDTKNRFEVLSGRVYGYHDRIFYPVEGPGVHILTNKEYELLAKYVKDYSAGKINAAFMLAKNAISQESVLKVAAIAEMYRKMVKYNQED